MNRRFTYLLLLVLLFAKSYVVAFPANAVHLPAGIIQKFAQHNSFSDAGNNESIIQHTSIISDDDNEEDDDYTPASKKQVLALDTIPANSFFAKGFLIHQFKNAFLQNAFYSSWHPNLSPLKSHQDLILSLYAAFAYLLSL